MHCCFPPPAAAYLNWQTFEGNRSQEEVHRKFSEAMERQHDPYGFHQCLVKRETHGRFSGWHQDWRNGFSLPWQRWHGTGLFSNLLLYTTGERDPSMNSLLNQNFKAKVNGRCALLGYHPPHCCLGSNSAERKPFLIYLQVLTMQRIEEIETILYFSSQRLKKKKKNSYLIMEVRGWLIWPKKKSLFFVNDNKIFTVSWF